MPTVSSPSVTTCPRCNAPVRGVYKFCPECAYRLAPVEVMAESVQRASRHSWPMWLLTAFVLALLGSLFAIGYSLLTAKPESMEVEERTPETRRLEVNDIDSQFEFVPGGIAHIGSETEIVKQPQPLPEDLIADVIEDLAFDWGHDEAQALLNRPTMVAGSWPAIFSTAWMTYKSSLEALRETREIRIAMRAPDVWLMRQEVTCGQYAAFVDAMHESPSTFRAPQWAHALWQPTHKEGQDYTRGYEKAWRRALGEHWAHIKASPSSSEDEALTESLKQLFMLPLSPKAAAWLLTPVSWVSLSPDGSLTYAIPKDQDDTPVTGVSWWDANIFVEWVRQRLANPNIKLPNEAEYSLAFHGGLNLDRDEEPSLIWPWGTEDDVQRCNNLNYGELSGQVRLDSVHREVARQQLLGSTSSRTSIVSLAGNAAEWVLESDFNRHSEPGRPAYYVARDDLDDVRVHMKGARKRSGWDRATLAGGSYRDGLDDCAYHPSRSWPSEDKRVRRAYIGFRLAMRPAPFGSD